MFFSAFPSRFPVSFEGQKNTRASLAAHNIQRPLSVPLDSFISFSPEISPWQVADKLLKSRPRWAEGKNILNVGYDMPPLKEKSLPVFLQVLSGACLQWQHASKGRFIFNVLDSPVTPFSNQEQLDIVIHWSQETTRGRAYEVGHANRILKKNVISHVDITLITSPLIDRDLSPKQQIDRLYATLLHELGHALGLEHSMQSSAVMFYRGWRQTQLTHDDKQELLLLYFL